MLFNTAKNKCLLEILKSLSRSHASYSHLFKKTKVSHITLQTALRELLEKGLVVKTESKGFRKQYAITEKGKTILRKMKYLDST